MSQGIALSLFDIARCAASAMTVREAVVALRAHPSTVWRRAKAARIGFGARRKPLPHPGMTAVLCAIRDGKRTSTEIAQFLSKPRPLVSLTLIYMEDRGLVQRRSTQSTKCGRPPIIWQLAEATPTGLGQRR